MQEIAFGINNRRVNNKWNWIKYLSFIPWISLFFLLGFYNGGFKLVDLAYKRAFGIPLPQEAEWVMYSMTVAIVLILALATGKRGFCHYLCWMAPFMIIGKGLSEKISLPTLILKTYPEKCTNCGICSTNCPISLPVMEMIKLGAISHSECILCANCVDSCPNEVIHYTFMRKRF